MFDVGFWEFILIGVITLIVVGPERLPSIAKKAGQTLGKIKRFIAQTQADVGEELKADNIKAHLSLQDETSNIVELVDQTKDTLNEIKQDLKQPIQRS